MKVLPQLSLAFYEKEKVPEGEKMVGIQLENMPLLDRFLKTARKDLLKAKAIKLPLPELKEEVVSIEKEIESKDRPEVTEGTKIIEMFLEVTESLKELSNLGKTLGELFKENPLISKDGYIPVRMTKEEKEEK